MVEQWEAQWFIPTICQDHATSGMYSHSVLMALLRTLPTTSYAEPHLTPKPLYFAMECQFLYCREYLHNTHPT